jgi:predicted MFS family arabinose efflux permease
MAFLALAAIGLMGLSLIWLLMPETRDTVPAVVPAGRRHLSRAVCSQPAE